VRLYRIADRRYKPASGEGARFYGARWNSPGRAVIYVCTTYAGAMLEKLVHTGRQIPRNQVCVTFEVPEAVSTETLDPRGIRAGMRRLVAPPAMPGWPARRVLCGWFPVSFLTLSEMR
jgi:RES domain-containing protein